jgi:hypothetical protein
MPVSFSAELKSLSVNRLQITVFGVMPHQPSQKVRSILVAGTPGQVKVVTAALWCAFGVVFLAVVAIQPESGWLLKLPQWVLLLPVGLLGLWAVGSNNALQETLRDKAAQRP